MARPTKAKEAKPKVAEQAGGPPAPKEAIFGINLVFMGVILVLCTVLSSAASVYFLTPFVIKPLLQELMPKEEDDEGDTAHEMPTIGPVLDLEEFTVNLKDTDAERYLRADLSISVTTEDPSFGKLTGEALHKWEEDFHMEMAHYVPAIRDIVIASLTKRTAAELSTTMGKEQIKGEIQKSVDAVFHGKHKVIRVNFENFIIQ